MVRRVPSRRTERNGGLNPGAGHSPDPSLDGMCHDKLLIGDTVDVRPIPVSRRGGGDRAGFLPTPEGRASAVPIDRRRMIAWIVWASNAVAFALIAGVAAVLLAAPDSGGGGFALGSGLMAGLALFSWLLVSLLVVLATFQWARGKRLALRLALPGPAWLIAVGSTWLIWQPLTIVLLLPVLVLWPILPAAWLGTMVWVPITLARDMRAEPDATPM